MFDIQKTINYFQFKFVASNRPIDKQWLAALTKKIQKKNLLPENPILVNSAMEVMDGQHRLKVAENLGLYIYYRVSDNVTDGDIGDLNFNNKKWTIIDFIHYHTKKGAPGFDVLSRFMLDHPLIPPSTIGRMIGPNNKLPRIKAGLINLQFLDKAYEIGAILSEYSKMIPWASDKNFVRAITNCVNTPGYDHGEMRRQLETQSRCLVRCIDTQQYTELFQEIYNRNKSKNLLKFKLA